MRNTEEQLREIMKRADRVVEKKASKKAVVSYALSAGVCVMLMVVAALCLPGLSSSGASQASGQYGSLLLNTSYMGFVVIGALAFLLGIFVTLLCLHIRKIKKKERDRK